MVLWKCTFGIASALVLLLAGTSQAEWVNGWWVYPFQTYTNSTISRRPYSPGEKGLSLHDLRISRMPINSKGIAIGATRVNAYTVWAYRWVSIWHVEISDIWRTPGMHIDFIHITGGANIQDVPTSLSIEDANIHDGDGIPIMIQDGIFDRISLKSIRARNTTVGVQICTINSGQVGTVVIDNCPNTSIALMGRPGSIKTCYIKNSPGARVGDALTKNGKSGVRIIYLD